MQRDIDILSLSIIRTDFETYITLERLGSGMCWKSSKKNGFDFFFFDTILEITVFQNFIFKIMFF